MSEGQMVANADPAVMWTLSEDRRRIRFALPPLPMAGGGEPLVITMNLDAEAVDGAIERLTMLRVQMLPGPRRAS
jgi:hypothetical protein